ncbi:MAG: hypothetical protein DA408_15625 [Bacteroidetes bacterium]|nr:MAG: hypothetical protein C7N36_05455 [Bacteroidota bacterium]PTM10596.1 MAG: hypothetical protein DA408_15625 [Bacteroidota bacterium]
MTPAEIHPKISQSQAWTRAQSLLFGERHFFLDTPYILYGYQIGHGLRGNKEEYPSIIPVIKHEASS